MMDHEKVNILLVEDHLAELRACEPVLKELGENVAIATSGREALTHVTVSRPWGKYTVLEERPGYKLKRIEVRPGGRLSLQSHEHRAEHWVVVSGVATVTIDGKVSTLERNQGTVVPLGSRHRLENRGTEPLQLIEVQVGDSVEEDDIKRYDDVYGRT